MKVWTIEEDLGKQLPPRRGCSSPASGPNFTYISRSKAGAAPIFFAFYSIRLVYFLAFFLRSYVLFSVYIAFRDHLLFAPSNVQQLYTGREGHGL